MASASDEGLEFMALVSPTEWVALQAKYTLATSEDLERLIGHIQETVEREHGIRLNPEFRILGTQ